MWESARLRILYDGVSLQRTAAKPRSCQALRMNRVSCILLVLACCLYAPRAHAAKATHNISYGSSALATTLWYPDGLPLIRGVLVFTGGQGSGVSSDTRAMADDGFWQRFAESVGFAIIGDQFTGSYTNAANGPGMALLDSLTALANETAHPELEHAPLLVEGFSNGGYFSFTFAQFAPARVIAFCVNKSGFATAPLDDAFLAVPGFLVWGSEEPATNTPTVIHDLVTAGRKKHALWAELREWGAGRRRWQRRARVCAVFCGADRGALSGVGFAVARTGRAHRVARRGRLSG